MSGCYVCQISYYGYNYGEYSVIYFGVDYTRTECTVCARIYVVCNIHYVYVIVLIRFILLIALTLSLWSPRPHIYQTRSAWSVDQGSNKNHSPAYNFAPTVTKFCVKWEGLSLPHDTKFGNCRCKIVDSRSFPSWSLIHGLRWSGLIKVGPGDICVKAY